MHAFLIVGRNPKALEEKTDKLVKKLAAKPMPFTVVKIADIRELTKLTRLTLNEKTAMIIKNFENATEEAQNAFLKALEEPQANLYFILTAQTLSPILPTIISRCQVTEISGSTGEADEVFQIPKEEQEKISNFLDAGVGEKLALTANIKNRQEATDFINKILILSHKKLLAGEKVVNLIASAQKTLSALKANGNIQLQLTNFVVSLEAFNSVA